MFPWLTSLVPTFSPHFCALPHVQALQSPYNFLGKKLLVEAELSAAAKMREAYVVQKFVYASALAKEGGLLMEAALSNESLGKYYFRLGKVKESQQYIEQAIVLYEKWGAVAKAKHLRSESGILDFPAYETFAS